MQTTRTPVTRGSKVPECPVFSTRKIRLIHATTSWELGRDGLSRHITPELKNQHLKRLIVTLCSLSEVCEEESSH